MKHLILKNMEALFIAALALAGMANYAAAKIPAVRAAHQAAPAVDGNLYTVTVSAKRLSAAGK